MHNQQPKRRDCQAYNASRHPDDGATGPDGHGDLTGCGEVHGTACEGFGRSCAARRELRPHRGNAEWRVCRHDRSR